MNAPIDGVPIVETAEGSWLVPRINLADFIDPAVTLPRPELMLYAYVGMLVRPPMPIGSLIQVN
jgi:hypothetical protein